MLTIGGVQIGAGQPCRFVAEISNNHNGSLARAHRLIDAAKAAGCDFIKTQAFVPSEIGALRGGMDVPAPSPWGDDGTTMAELYERAKTPFDWFPELVNHCEAIGLPWFSSVFGAESLSLLESLGCPAYKIARLDNEHSGFVSSVRKIGKPVIISCDVGEPQWGRLLRGKNLHVLYAPPGYPQEHFSFEIAFAWDPYSTYNDPLGFSYHGTNPDIPLMSVSHGVHLIEAHMMLADEPSYLESNVSLTEHQMAELISRVRAVEEMLA